MTVTGRRKNRSCVAEVSCGVGLSTLEIRLERSKRISNSIFELLKLVHDKRTVAERYGAIDVDLHVHFAIDRMICATYRRMDFVEIVVPESTVSVDATRPLNPSEFPMFVSVRDIAQPSRPVASVVRLQPLDCCPMCGIDSVEPGLFVSNEALARTLKGKLGSAYLAAGIELGEFKNEIVECGSEIVANFSDEDSNHRSNVGFDWTRYAEAVGGLRVEIDGDCLHLTSGGDIQPPLDVRKVFACPRHSIKRWIESVKCHDILHS